MESLVTLWKKKIVEIFKKEFENDENNFFPWLHQRFNYWNEEDKFEYLQNNFLRFAKTCKLGKFILVLPISVKKLSHEVKSFSNI